MPYDARSYAENDKPYVNRSKTPRMQRAHFEFIAAQLRDARPSINEPAAPAALAVWRDVVYAFGVGLAGTNPRFERAAFYRASGVDEVTP